MKYYLSLLMLLMLSACNEPTPKDIATSINVKKILVPLKDRMGTVDPLADSTATFGGKLNLWGGPSPKSLNFWLEPSSSAATVSSLMFEELVSLHSSEDKPVGVLAKSWVISEDGKTFTFKLNPLARWSDGKQILAEDIQFYYDVIMNKKNLTTAHRVSLSRFKRPKIIDSLTIEFFSNKVHWKNFWTAAGSSAFPKHIWGDVDFNKQNFEFPVVSGPYIISKLKKNRSVELTRRLDWWGDSLAYNYGKFNFNKLRYKYMEDRVKTLEAFKKGDLDVYPIYTASIWMKQTNFDAVEMGWVNRERIYNKRPIGGQGFAMNLRKAPYSDPKVREALTLLLDRKTINDKLMYKQYFMLNSYFPDLYEKNQNPNIPMDQYDTDKARALLKEAGWLVDSKGKLKKNSKNLVIKFMTSMADTRHLEIYASSLKSVGIIPKIEKLNNPTILKNLDNLNFDMYWRAWGAGRLRDPEPTSSSKTANEKATLNLPGFQNTQVDSLIEIQKVEFDLSKRNTYLIEMDEILFKERPNVLLWNNDHHRLLSWNKYSRPTAPLGMYGNPDDVVTYWYLDKAKEQQLKKAKKENKKLEAFPSHTYWKQ